MLETCIERHGEACNERHGVIERANVSFMKERNRILQHLWLWKKWLAVFGYFALSSMFESVRIAISVRIFFARSLHSSIVPSFSMTYCALCLLTCKLHLSIHIIHICSERLTTSGSCVRILRCASSSLKAFLFIILAISVFSRHETTIIGCEKYSRNFDSKSSGASNMTKRRRSTSL